MLGLSWPYQKGQQKTFRSNSRKGRKCQEDHTCCLADSIYKVRFIVRCILISEIFKCGKMGCSESMESDESLEKHLQLAFHEWVSGEPKYCSLLSGRQALRQLEPLGLRPLASSMVSLCIYPNVPLNYYHLRCNIGKGQEVQLWKMPFFSLAGFLILHLLPYHLHASGGREYWWKSCSNTLGQM